jgi:hypothetical protein
VKSDFVIELICASIIEDALFLSDTFSNNRFNYGILACFLGI